MDNNKKGEKFEKDYFLGENSNYKKGYELDEARLAEIERKVNFLKEAVPDKTGIKILDIGCAFGYFLAACDKFGWETNGVDISQHAINQAKSITVGKVQVLDMARQVLPYQDNYFDVIASFDLLEHLSDEKIFFQEAERTLKPGGLLLVETVYGKSLADKDETHINIKSEDELREIFEKYNFTILSAEKDRYYPIRIIPLRRFKILNLLNQKICNILGLYLKPIKILARKK